MTFGERLGSVDILSLISDNMEAKEPDALEIWTTPAFDRWFSKLRDRAAKAKIAQYFDAVAALGRLKGDLKPVGDHVTEVRFNFGPGYRVYLTQEGDKLVLLLVGGDKSSQHRDIRKAKELATEWRRGHENQ